MGSYVGKCNSGAWVSMGYGVDCATCPNPHASSVSVGGTNNSVVTVTGVFDFGYNASAPFEVDCTTSGLLYWHSDSSTTGHWSNNP